MECTYDTTGRDDMVLAGLSTREEMCLSFVFVYPAPDLYSCRSGFSDDAVAQWLDDAYYAGYWDMNWTDDNGSYYNVEQAIEFGFDPREMHMDDWQDFNGIWYSDKDGAAEFYERFWDSSYEAYSGRLSRCYRPLDSGIHYELVNNSFVEDFGEFEEYCMDSCGCEESTTTEDPRSESTSTEKPGSESTTTEETGSGDTTSDDDGDEEGINQSDDDEDDGNALMIAFIVLIVMLVIAIGVIVYLVTRNMKLKE